MSIAVARGWIATFVFQTPIASGQHIGRKNLILVMIQGLLGENQDGFILNNNYIDAG